jgi:hypothetical protein
MLWNVPLVLSVLVVWCWALSMLESALCRRSIASILLLWCLLAVISARAALLWLLWILLAVALSLGGSVALARRGRAVLVWRGVLLLAVALVVLIVRSGHCVGLCLSCEVGLWLVGGWRD